MIKLSQFKGGAFMGTPYSQIYNAYFLRVKDDIYDKMEAEELELELQQLLEAALPRFYYCKVNLEDRDLDGFTVVLTSMEIQIIAILMNIIWAESEISNIEVTRQVFRDHDFNLTSQASHLRGLIAMRSELDKIVTELLQKYYMTTNREADLSGLAGG
jgi:hypothetical protein